MGLLPCTAKVIAEVEELSGKRVVVEEDPSLATLATVRIARGAVPFHLVRYRPGGAQAGSGAGAGVGASGDTTNYLIVYQLGFLVRLFSRPSAERWEVGATADEKARGIDGLGLAHLASGLAAGLFDQLITQLLNLPDRDAGRCMDLAGISGAECGTGNISADATWRE